MKRLAMSGDLLAGCGAHTAPSASRPSHHPIRDIVPLPDTAPTVTTAIQQPATAPTTAPRPTTTIRPSRRSGGRVASTAYCETGTMANGHVTADIPDGVLGNVAANRWPIGTVLTVDAGPHGAGRYAVGDRIGSGSELDYAIPGNCAAARRWGRRTVTVTAVS